MRDKIIYTIAFFNFIGYYILLLLIFNWGADAISTNFTIALRLIVLICIGTLLFYQKKNHSLISNILFLIFSVCYLVRIAVDSLLNLRYYLDIPTLLLYFISLDVIPFFVMTNIRIKLSDYDIMRKAILFSGFLFSMLAIFFFKNFIGTVGRLSEATAEMSVISPLALSYCSSLIIGVAVGYWMENKISLKYKIYLLIIIGMSATPFFLGASRGSLITLFLPMAFVFFTKNILVKLKSIIPVLIIFTGVIILSESFGSSLIERFTSTKDDFAEGNESADRAIMWKNGLNQFVNNPIFGDRLKLDGYDIYPHNIFIEILQTTGFLGFIPFLILIIITFYKAFKICKYSPSYSWVAIIFIQSFTQNMFSGGIFYANWLIMSMAMVITFNEKDIEDEPLILLKSGGK